jgi:transposase InsO family protein
MPFEETNAMEQRMQFILEWLREWEQQEGRVNLSRLCRAYGVHRPTGRKWVQRYIEAGFALDAMKERSRRPHSSPTTTERAVVERVIAARKKYPYWGPRKLRVFLLREASRGKVPSASTIGEILKREGLVGPRRRRRRTPAYTQPFAACKGPNDVWCIDFKGQFRTGDGKVCYPLTITDAYSRYLIRCEVVARPDADGVRPVMESAFAELGLPAAIRSDNGPPFATTGAGGFSELSIWWRKLTPVLS